MNASRYWKWALFCSLSSGCAPRAARPPSRPVQTGQQSKHRSDLVHEQKTPVVVSESPRSQAPAARFSLRSVYPYLAANARVAPPPRLWLTVYPLRYPHAARLLFHGSVLGRPFDFAFIVLVSRKVNDQLTSAFLNQEPLRGFLSFSLTTAFLWLSYQIGVEFLNKMNCLKTPTF